MERTQRIVERLPGFYRAWDDDSVMYKFLDSFGRSLNEQQKDLYRILRAHWVDTAYNSDLDSLGSLLDLKRSMGETDDEYRTRIKRLVQAFKGGGTRDAILSLAGAMLGVREDESLELIENPPTLLFSEKKVGSGDTWTVGSMGIEDSEPFIEIDVRGDESLRIRNPVVTNKDIDETLRFRGEIISGHKLTVGEGTAQLDGNDVRDRVSASGTLKLSRSGSNWYFEEELSSQVGHFDRSSFDKSIFDIPVPQTIVRFSWISKLPSCFELRIPSKILDRSGQKKEDVEAFLEIVKASGIRSIVTIGDGDTSKVKQ